jgi:hypothetical protein
MGQRGHLATRRRSRVRETLFGAGHGLLAFHVNDRDETIRIFNILWIS